MVIIESIFKKESNLDRLIICILLMLLHDAYGACHAQCKHVTVQRYLYCLHIAYETIAAL